MFSTIGAMLLGKAISSWNHGQLVIQSFKNKLAKKQVEDHAEINRNNEEIDKELSDEKAKVKSIDPDNLLDSLRSMRDDGGNPPK